MKDTYGKKLYTCKCGNITEGYVWSKCGKWVGYENLEKKVDSIISIRTPTKNR